MGAYQDLTVDQGTDFSTSMAITAADGTFINIATYQFVGQVRTSYYTANVSANLLVTIVDAPNGNLSISLDSANTANMVPGRYVYDVKMTIPGSPSNTSRLVEGIFILTPSVTH